MQETDILNYIKVFENIVPNELCNKLMSYDFKYGPAHMADHHKDDYQSYTNSVSMEEAFIISEHELYTEINLCFNKLASLYKYPHLYLERKTNCKILKYSAGGFINEHTDTLGYEFFKRKVPSLWKGINPDLQYGMPNVTLTLYLNDDYEGGDLIIAKKNFGIIKKGSGVCFPSNFIFPHAVTKVTKGTRYAIVCWYLEDKL